MPESSGCNPLGHSRVSPTRISRLRDMADAPAARINDVRWLILRRCPLRQPCRAPSADVLWPGIGRALNSRPATGALRFGKRTRRRTPSTLESLARSAVRLEHSSLCAAAPLPRWFPRKNMVKLTIVFALLVVPYLIEYLFHYHNFTLAGRMRGCLVFLFAALGQFFKTDSMISMLPPFVLTSG